MPLQFSLLSADTSTRARLGSLRTRHASFETPQFMPVGTFGMVRGLEASVLDELGYSLLLANTFHLIVRPGLEVIRRRGGLRSFTGWPHGFLTDSGGFQVFSLAKSRVMTEKGVRFRNYLNGSEILLTPELSMEAQEIIGSDIRMVLDECVASTVGEPEAVAALQRTYRWAKRSFEASRGHSGAVFGIVQGARFPRLREESAAQILSLDFDGFAIGGLAVGEPREEREAMTETVTKLLPETKPRYLMGVGMPLDLVEAVARGVDIFDCVLPASLSQQGVAFGWNGKVDLRKGRYAESQIPLDETCPCRACRTYDRAFLSHLVRIHDHAGWSLVGTHNHTFLKRLLTQARTELRHGTFASWYRAQRDSLGGNEP